MPDKKSSNPFLEIARQTTGVQSPISSPQKPITPPTKSSNPFLDLARGLSGPGLSVPTVQEKPGTLSTVVTTIAPVLDFLSRGQYASAKFFDSMSQEGGTILESLAAGFDELVAPKDRLSFRNVLERNNPTWVAENDRAASVIGFLGDVFLDPTTYLGVGLGKTGLTVGRKTLSELGEQTLKKEITRLTGKSVLQGFAATGRASATPLAKRVITTSKQIVEDTIETKLFREMNVQVPGFLKGKPVPLKALRNSTNLNPTELDGILTRLVEEDVIKLTQRSVKLNGNFNTVEDMFKKFGFDKTELKGVEFKDVNLLPDPFAKPIRLGESAKSFFRTMTTPEVRENAERLVAQAFTADNALKLFKPEGVRLTVGLPFAKQYDVPGSRQLLNALGLGQLQKGIARVSNYLNLAASKSEGVVPAVAKGAVGAKNLLGATFNRYTGDVPEEYIKAAKTLEDQFDYISGDVIRTTRKMFEGIPKDRRELLGQTMLNVDDLTREAESLLGRNLTVAESANIVRNTLTGAKLKQEEFATAMSLYQSYKSAAELETTAGLLKNSLVNYSPRYYKELADPNVMAAARASKFGLKTNAPSFKARTFETLQEAKANGYVPELDAAVLYAQRMLTSRRAMAAKQFRESLNTIYGIDVPIEQGVEGSLRSTFKSPGLDALPDKIKNDIKLLGESIYPMYLNSDMRQWLTVVDSATSIWRRFATVAKPGFAFKQLISNSIQAGMIQGVKAFKLFDPRSAMDAALLVMDKNVAPKAVPPFFQSLIRKNVGVADSILAERVALSKIGGLNILEDRVGEAAAGFKLTNVLGEVYDGKQLVELMRKHNVVRGFDSTGDRFTKSLEQSLNFNDKSRKAVTKELAKWWNHAAVVEDYARAMTFINGVRMGHSVEQAVNLTNKALFDYAHGLSAIEKNVIRRIIPFYTFQRFAIPEMLKQVTRKPGNAATVDKTFKLFDKLINKGETLTEDERTIFGESFLVEQPRLFKGFDKDGKATFNMLSNITPLDSISLMKFNDKGDVDFQKTAESTVLAALTPFIKIPLEVAVNRNFFTQQVIEKGGNLGNIEGSLGAIIPQPVKDAMGWEARTNPQGDVKVYINPYLAHTATSFFPTMKSFIRQFDADVPFLQGMEELLTGIPTVKVDLKQQGKIAVSENTKKLREAVAKLRSAKIRGSQNDFEKAMEDYQFYMREIQRTGRATAGIKTKEGVGEESINKDFK